jgi:carboxylesterase type B
MCAIGNYALMDQQLAFQFVKQHAAEFGGNPNEITAEG